MLRILVGIDGSQAAKTFPSGLKAITGGAVTGQALPLPNS